MRMVIATKNKGKLLEFKELFCEKDMEILSWDEAGLPDIEIEENGDTLEENSYIKASEVCKRTNMPSLADDSGLFVDALFGEPGVNSARYSGVHGDDAANRKLLLEKLKDVPFEKRTAFFATVITLVYPDGKKIVARGECHGKIALCETGDRGFGYDSVFIPDGSTHTFAELPLEYKNSISHRHNALVNLEKMI